MRKKSRSMENKDGVRLMEELNSLGEFCRSSNVANLLIPEISHWSIGQHIHHVLKADRLNFKAAEVILSGKGSPWSDKSIAVEHPVMKTGVIPRGVSKAPEFVQPPKKIDVADLEALRLKVMDLWQGVLPALQEDQEEWGMIPHHALGELGALDWLRFAWIHSRHHGEIAHEIWAARGSKSDSDSAP